MTTNYILERRWHRRFDSTLELLPVSVMLATMEDGRHIATAERKNGELLTLEVPDRFERPDEAFGRWLLTEILPPDVLIPSGYFPRA